MWSLVASIAIWTGIVLGSLLLLALVVPVQARAAGAVGEDDFDASAEVSWGWGLLALHWNLSKGAAIHLLGLRLMRIAASSDRDADQDEPKDKKKRAKSKKDKKSKRGLAWFREHRRALLRLVGRLMRALGLRGQLWMRVGLDDPAHTAALIQTLVLIERAIPGLELWVEPDYLEETLEANGNLAMGLWLPELLGIALARLLFDGPTRALLKRVRA